MTTEANKTDDFDTAFAQFASPDKSADAAAAGTDDTSASAAASGGGDGAGNGGDSAADSQSGADTGAAGTGADTGADGGAEGASNETSGGEGAAAEAQAGTAGVEGAPGDAGSGEGAAGQAGGDAGAVAGAEEQAQAGPTADDILEGLKKLVGDAKPAADDNQGGGDQAAATEDKPLYSKEEEEFLKTYDEDWGTVARGEALKRKAEYQELLKYVFTQVAEFVKPIQETADILAERTFRTELTTTVPDYSNELRDQVVNWVKKQPTYLQVAYNHVITEGSVDEVKDLIGRYRSSTGQTKTGAGAPAGQKKTKENELSDEAKKAAAALAPVDSKRSGVQAPSDPSNFDDAWKQAAADLK